MNRLARLTKTNIVLLWALIFVLGLLVGYLGGRDSRERQVTRLMDEAKRCAAAVPPDDLRALTGTRADLASPDYRRLKDRLALLQALNPEARLVFVVRFRPDTGKAVFLADSAPSDSGTLMAPGDDYGQVTSAPALRRVIDTNLASVRGPVADAAGAWALGFALAAAPPAGSPTRDVVGLDVSADDWSGAWWGAALAHTLCAWLLLGLPFGVFLAVRGQSEQRKAIRNLLGAVEQSHSAVMIVDLDSCIEYVNVSLCTQLGYSRRELLGRRWRDFQQPETSTELIADMVAAVRTGSSWRGEWLNRRRNGELYPVRGSISPVKHRDGGIACYVAVLEDMTEFKRGEAVLRAALDRAEAGDRSKSQFLATMSHEVRTPLNGIVGFTSLLLDMPLSPEQSEYVQMIRANSEALIQLTGDILDFAHIESGSLKLEPGSCNLRGCVEETLDVLALPAAKKKVELLHWVDDAVPVSIQADAVRLRQVLVNLAGNAVKFTEAGEVALTVQSERVPGTADEFRLTFSVRDTGIGIAPEDHEKLFKPFNQVDVSNTRRHGGTGLGLAICRKLAQLMGGSISFESGLGRGSTFLFTIPATELPSPARPAPAIDGMRLALAARPGPFRDEFVRLARRWRAPLIEADTAANLANASWDAAFVELDAAAARALVSPPAAPAIRPANAEDGALQEVEKVLPLPADKTYALVSIALARELRLGLRGHFRQIINKPLHHDALLALLAGVRSVPAPEEPPARFEFNVLVAEDNLVNQRLAQKLLWNLGCTSTIAENGRVVIDELIRGSTRYDLVLMDLHMPEMDGPTAIEKIRAGEAGEAAKGLWIAALTADARVEQRERVLAAGADDYIIKPIKLGELAEALRRCAKGRPQASS